MSMASNPNESALDSASSSGNTAQPKTPLGNLVKNNDITIIADLDHADAKIPKSMDAQMPDARSSGQKVHLFLEHDAKETKIESLAAQDNSYGQMIRNAQANGGQVHLYDDRTADRALKEKYPTEYAAVNTQDPYMRDQAQLIKDAKDPEKMQEFLREYPKTITENIPARNEKIAQNIAETMDKYPGEKAVVMLGAGHVGENNDVDEMLRKKGYSVATMEIVSPETNPRNIVRRLDRDDKPDIVMHADTGKVISAKDPATGEMHRVTESSTIPWKNNEPVGSSVSSPAASSSAVDAPKSDVAVNTSSVGASVADAGGKPDFSAMLGGAKMAKFEVAEVGADLTPKFGKEVAGLNFKLPDMPKLDVGSATSEWKMPSLNIPDLSSVGQALQK